MLGWLCFAIFLSWGTSGVVGTNGRVGNSTPRLEQVHADGVRVALPAFRGFGINAGSPTKAGSPGVANGLSETKASSLQFETKLSGFRSGDVPKKIKGLKFLAAVEVVALLGVLFLVLNCVKSIRAQISGKSHRKLSQEESKCSVSLTDGCCVSSLLFGLWFQLECQNAIFVR